MGSDISKYSVGLASLLFLWISKSKSLIGLIAIILIVSTENGFGQSIPPIEITQTITTTGAGSYTVPTGVTSINVEAWGGGGRGGSVTNNSNIGGGGGGGGAYAISTISVTPDSSISYSIGQGGNNLNVSGGRTIFGPTGATFVEAAGGLGVSNSTSTTNGASGGGRSGNLSKGQITYLGGNGANGRGSGNNTRGGGGGSSAGSSQDGNNASGRTGGAAPTDGGAGGTAPNSRNTNGVDGASPGGGGSGAARQSANRTGGAGANGQIRISYQASLTVTSPNDINIGTRAEYTITRNGPTTAAATVNLSSSGATGGQFFGAASGGTAITSVSIPVGSTSVTFYFTGNAGTHTVNFASPGYLPASDVLVINQPASTVTVKSGTTSSFTFTGSAQGLGVSDFDFTGSAGTRSVLYTGVPPTIYNSATTPTNAGTYQVVASVAEDANFSSGSSAPFDFSITSINITITPDAGQSKTVGDPEPVLTFQSSGWLGSDNSSLLQGVLSRDIGEEVGNYIINLGSLTVTNSNYVLSLVEGVTFEIKAVAATQYIVATSTTSPRAGTALTITAQLADEFGSSASESGRVVTWSELSVTSGTFSSATSVTNAQGIATVQFTTSSTIGVSTKITATGSGGLFGTSPEITTVDAVPTQLVFVQDPSGSSTVAGVAFATQPIVHILDAEGNLVSSATKEVTLSLFEGSGELRGNITMNAVNGVATFAGLNIDLVGSDKIIIAESEGLASATTSPFTITPAPASLFTKYVGDLQAAQVGTAVDIAPAVRVQDIFGNPISGVSVSFSVSSGGGNIQPTTAVLTDSDGIAFLTSWTLGTTAGQNILTASSEGFSTLTFTALGSEDAIQEFLTSTTWTVPPGVTEITVEGWGGGGAGGGVVGRNSRTLGGSGGGGGAYAKSILPVTPGETLQISVGSGGAGVVGGNGNQGGTTSISGFEDIFLAQGGSGGRVNNDSGAPLGGQGGEASSSNGTSSTQSGSNGGNGGTNSGAGGQGAKGGGAGGLGISSGSFNGNTGNSPGGGGGGGRVNRQNANAQGGVGGSGKITIIFPKPVNQFRAATSGNWEDENTWEQQFSNGQFAKINSKPAANSNAVISAENIKVTVSNDLSVSGSITVVSDSELVLASGKNLTLNSGSTLSIGNEGILTLPSNGLVLGEGTVAINKGSTLAIAHPEGVQAIGTAGGAIQNTGTRNFSEKAKYIYNGTAPQVIGNGLPAVVNELEVENPTIVTLDRPLKVAVDLEIDEGTLQLDHTLTVELNLKLNGSSSILIKEGKTLQAELLSNIITNNTSRIILQPGAKYFNLGISAPQLEVRQNLTGTRGWRMMGAPVRETTYQDFLGEIESQGFPGSTRPNLQPNVLWWDETDAGTTAQGWRQPVNISQQVSSGRGHYVFVFDGANLPGGSSESYSDVLPLTVATTGQELNLNSGGFTFDISYTQRNNQITSQNNNFTEVSITDAGFNLISNPTASYIDFQKAAGWQKANIDQTIYIWNQNRNNGNGGFELFQGSNPANFIAPFQAFWIKANAPDPVLTINNEAKSFATSSFFGRVLEESPKTEALKIKLNVSSAKMEAESILRFSPEGKDEKDEWDAYQLESLGNNWLLLYSYGSPKENTPLAINHLSLPQEAEEKSIPLNLAAAWEGKPFGDDYLLTWELPAAWPSNQKVVLMDHISEKAIDMGKISEYRFNFKAPTSSNTNLRIDGQGMKSPQAVVFSSPFESGNPNARVNPESPKRPFTIVIGYQGTGTESEYRPEMPKLFTPYPNPFIDRTRIKFYLPMTATAEIKIFDTNGMTVGQFDAAEYLAGVHELDWAPAGNRLPAGIYILQLITGENVLTQKLLKK